MAGRKNYAVATEGRGLNVRKFPAKTAPVIRVLSDGEKIAVDNTVEVPSGWKKLLGDDGFVMAEFLK